MKTQSLFMLTAMSFLLTACYSEFETTETERAPSSKSEPVISANDLLDGNTRSEEEDLGQVVAVYGNESLSLEDLDSHMSVALFDLEWRKYQLRKETLKSLLEAIGPEQLQAAPATVLLQPPSPPRLEIPMDKRATIGDLMAPVTLAVFCSYQSSHCARLQPVLKELRKKYSEYINLRFYDYPQRFHRYGYTTANAVHCAHEQGVMSAYQSALYMDQQSLDNDRLVLIAEQLGLDLDQFRQCAESGKYASNIDADIELGKNLGLGNVPIVLVNGLYAKGPQSVESYSYYIDQELSRINIVFTQKIDHKPVESTLPFELMATMVSSDDSESIAQISVMEDRVASNFKIGDELKDGIILLQIEAQRVVIKNGHQLEYLTLKNRQNSTYEANTLSSEQDALNDANIHYETVPGAPGREDGARPYRELPATGEMVLNKDWLVEQLANRSELESKFHLADHVVQGVHLIKLKGIEDDRFYNTLGLRSGDVIMRINEQWVHEKQNPLWGALENDQKISIHLVRKGLPVRYDYRVY